jgi:dipeptidase
VREGNGSMVDYSPTAAYWIFTKVSQFVYTRYSDMIKHVNELQHKFEFGAVRNINDMEGDMVNLFKNDPAKAQKRINDISNRCTQEVCNAWNNLFEYLLVKYNDGNVKVERNGRFVKTNTQVP